MVPTPTYAEQVVPTLSVKVLATYPALIEVRQLDVKVLLPVDFEKL
jgi:hypothetical protein